MSTACLVYLLLSSICNAKELKVGITQVEGDDLMFKYAYDDSRFFDMQDYRGKDEFSYLSFNIDLRRDPPSEALFIDSHGCNDMLQIYREEVLVVELLPSSPAMAHYSGKQIGDWTREVAAYNPGFVRVYDLRHGLSFGDCKKMALNGLQGNGKCSLRISECSSEPDKSLKIFKANKNGKANGIGAPGAFSCFFCGAKLIRI